MKIITNKPETQSAIKCFLCKSKVAFLAKQGFFLDWANQRNQNNAVECAEWHDDFIPVLENEAIIAFDNMLTAIDNEVLELPFKSSEWRS